MTCSLRLRFSVTADSRLTTGKLGCDHAVPCGRCVRRQLAHQCFYDPVVEETAGTQRRREPTAARPQPKKYSQVSTSQLVGNEGLQPATPRRLSEPSFLPNHARLNLSSGQLGAFASSPSLDVSAYSNQVGFMGSSSYSAVFDQINGSLDIPETGNILDPAVYTSPVPEELVRKGADVLFHLRDLEMLDALLQRWLRLGDGYLIFEDHAIFAQGRVVLQRVLDRILEPPSKQVPAMLTDEGLDLAWLDAIPPIRIGAKRCRVYGMAKQRLA